MYRYTTPTLPITIENIDFGSVDNFRIAIEQGKEKVFLFIVEADDPSVDPEENKISLELTQEQTATLQEGIAKLQIRIVYSNGRVQATRKVRVTINDVIDEVIV